MDRVTSDREVVFIRRRGRERVALVAAAELDSLMETARLLSSLRRALRGGRKPQSVAKLRRDLGLERAG